MGVNDDEAKKLKEQQRLDAQRLAEEKAALERTEKARQDGVTQRTAVAQQQVLRDEEYRKKTTEDKRLSDEKLTQDAKQNQDLLQQRNHVVAAEAIAPGQPVKEPDWLLGLRGRLTSKQNSAVKFDPKTGQIIFSGPHGLDALKKLIGENPNVRFKGVGLHDKDLKDEFQELKDKGILDNLQSIEMADGKVYEGEDLKKLIQKKINWPPKPTPTGSQ